MRMRRLIYGLFLLLLILSVSCGGGSGASDGATDGSDDDTAPDDDDDDDDDTTPDDDDDNDDDDNDDDTTPDDDDDDDDDDDTTPDDDDDDDDDDNDDDDTTPDDDDDDNDNDDDNDDNDDDTSPAELNGAVEKGPFILGSLIALAAVDDQCNPTGENFNSATINDLGDFNIVFSYRGYVSMECTGYYYNEITGGLSASPLTMRAYYNVRSGGAQSAYLNIITHLSYNRIKTLITQGADFNEAIDQAELELRMALQIGVFGFDPEAGGTEMNILGGDNDANAFLFAVSATVVKAAEIRASGGKSVDSELQQLLNTISTELKDDGTISVALTQELHDAQVVLDPAEVMALLHQYLINHGHFIAVPNLNRVLDYDFDGYSNEGDNCPFKYNPGQEDGDEDGTGDVCECGNEEQDPGEQCDDGNDIPGDGCENDCTWTCVTNPDCDDTFWCTGDETCVDHVCHDGTARCPQDMEFCNGTEICIEETDSCGHTGDPCDEDEYFCNGEELCNEDTDSCYSAGNPCTDDAVYCNGAEMCNEDYDNCYSTGNPCPQDDGLYCNGEEGATCNAEPDECEHFNVPDCPDDNLYCTGTEYCNDEIDDCDSTGDPCPDDGQYCNGDEVCDEDNDQCDVENLPDCPDDAVYCNGTEFCDEENDRCDHSGDPCPDDENWCNGDESCDEELGCVHSDTPLTKCPDDELYCNGTESCDEVNEKCAHSGYPCSSDYVCVEQSDSCDEIFREYLFGGLPGDQGVSLVQASDDTIYIASRTARTLYLYTLVDGLVTNEEVAVEFGQNPSLAMGSTDDLHLTYFDAVDQALVYSIKTGGTWTDTVIDDSSGMPGWRSDLKLEDDDTAHIGYLVTGSQQIRYATNESGTWVKQTVASGLGDGGEYWSVAMDLDSDGFAYIAYYDYDDNLLKYAANATGTWAIDDVDSISTYPGQLAIAVNEYYSFMVHILFDGMKFISGTPGSWSTPETIDTGYCRYPSLLVDDNGELHAVYRNGPSMKYGHSPSGSWIIESIDDSMDDNGGWNDFLVDSTGHIHAVYHTNYQGVVSACPDGSLAYAVNGSKGWSKTTIGEGGAQRPSDLLVNSEGDLEFANLNCSRNRIELVTRTDSGWQTEVVDSFGSFSSMPSMAMDSNYHAHICYFEELTGNLKYANNVTGTWQKTVIDNLGYSDSNPCSIFTDNDDKIHISYNSSDWKLNYATNLSGSWETEEVTDVCEYCWGTSIAVDSTGKVIIAYVDTDALKEASKAAETWSFGDITTDCDWAGEARMTIDDNDTLHIAQSCSNDHSDYYIRYLFNSGSGWVSMTVYSMPYDFYETYSAITTDSYDLFHIAFAEREDLSAYQYGKSNLMYTNYADNVQVIDDVMDLQGMFQMEIDLEGKVHIVYSCEYGLCHAAFPPSFSGD